MLKSKKELLLVITFTIALTFAFININYFINVLKYILLIANPFIIGIVIAFVINVLMNKISNNKIFNKLNKNTKNIISLIISLVIIFGFISLVFLLVIPQLTKTIEIFLQNSGTYKENVNNFFNSLGLGFKIDDGLINSLVSNLTNYIQNNKNNLLNVSVGIATNILTGFVNFTIALVFAIYLLVNKETLTRQINKVMMAYLSDSKNQKIKKIAKLSNKTFANFISGQCIEALIIGVLCFIGMFILRLPYAGPISVLVGFTALIPVFGAFFGTLIGAFLIFMIDPAKAIVFVIFIIVLQQFEGNLIYPKVVGKSVGLPSIWVLVAVTLGATISGITGMLLAVPICSILYSIVVENVNSRLNLKK